MFRKVALFSLILAFFIIVFSSSVRLFDTGLGCPKWAGWAGCYGQPLDNNSSTAEASSSLAKLVPVLLSHRVVIGTLGLGVLFLMVSAWLQRGYRLAAVFLTNVILILVAGQLALGFSAQVKLMPVVVMGQILLGFMTFWLLYWLYLRSNPTVQLAKSKQSGLNILAILTSLVLFIQITLGIWVSINNAGFACPDFPQCNNQWLPQVDYLQALDLWSIWKSGYTGLLPFDNQVAVHWLHRTMTIVSFCLLTSVMFIATSEKNPAPLRKSGVLLSGLLLLEILLGIFIIRLELALLIVTVHHLVAALLMLPLIAVGFYSKYTLPEALSTTEETEPVTEQVIVPVVPETRDDETVDSLYLRLRTQLKKTRGGLGGILSSLSLTQKGIDEDLLEQIESGLLMADIGIEATTEIINQLTDSVESHQLNDIQALEAQLKQILLTILKPVSQPLVIPQQSMPFVILVVGINGVGKTTTIGKLAKRLQQQGHSVMLAAGDTYRAAAVEQLQTWGERNHIHVVAQHTGADSASVIYDGVQSAQAKGIDVLIADTAGRLHTKSNLMEELSKIKRIMGKLDETAPHEVLLVLDAGTGQNALSQTNIFNEVVKLTGLVLTKLDGTAKGGVIFALAKKFGLPIRYIGVGEGIDDLQDFNADKFVNALFEKD